MVISLWVVRLCLQGPSTPSHQPMVTWNHRVEPDTSTGEVMAISMTWESSLYVNVCEPNLHIGHGAHTVRCIYQHASPTVILYSSLAGSPRRLAFLLPEYSSRRGSVQSRPVPACVPLPWEGNHTLRIRVSSTPFLIYCIHMYLQWTCWPLLSAAGFLVSHDHVLTGQSWRAGIRGSCHVYNVETNCWALRRKCDTASQAVHKKGVSRPRPRGPQRAEKAAARKVEEEKSDTHDEHPPTYSCSLTSHIFTWDLFTRAHTHFCVCVCARLCKIKSTSPEKIFPVIPLYTLPFHLPLLSFILPPFCQLLIYLLSWHTPSPVIYIFMYYFFTYFCFFKFVLPLWSQ